MKENYHWFRTITLVGKDVMIKSKYYRYIIEREVLIKKVNDNEYKLIYPNPLRI